MELRGWGSMKGARRAICFGYEKRNDGLVWVVDVGKIGLHLHESRET
jgi:hypothetical protein